jgi:aminopeptidase-like protein
MKNVGDELHALARRLWPLNRSLTGDGVRETLAILAEQLPGFEIHEVPTGTACFDWTVPREWRVREAWVANEAGEKIIDFADNNLYLVGYSTPVDRVMPLEELQEHLYSLPENPAAIPYITSYYRERWGFCLSQNQRDTLETGSYQVCVDSELLDGSLSYGELRLPGKTDREILLSTYVCHPSMGNNELSGPVVTAAIARWLIGLPRRRYSYRIVFIPETIGSIAYLSRHWREMQAHTDAGYVLTCIGDDRAYSYLESRRGDTLADRAALHVMCHKVARFDRYSFLDRGSDERQYCSPGIDLPVGSIMRSKYGTYPEYHTSLDDLSLITPSGLQGGFDVVKETLVLLEANYTYRTAVLGEPQLGKRGLYPTLSTRDTKQQVAAMMDLIAYADGSQDLIAIAEKIGVYAGDLVSIADRLSAEGVLKIVERI